MASYTTNYGLHQWEATDNFLRTDFNADHQLIDGALAELEGGKVGIVQGRYTGNGAVTRNINLGFRAKAVIVAYNDCFKDGYAGMALADVSASGFFSYQVVTITDTGFQVIMQNGAYKDTNQANAVYTYCAIV